MIFKILGTEMGPIVLSDEERKRALPDIDSLFDMYFNKHLAENLMEHVKNEPARCENIVSKVVDAVAENEAKKYQIQSITANHKKNAFTVVWGDGSHTIIHLQPGDVWDDEKALAMCFVKHMMGDKGSFNDIFTEEMPAKIKHIGKVEPIEEKDCECSGRREEGIHSCENCSCHAEAEQAAEASVKTAFNKMSKSAEKATVAMKKLIDEFTDYPIFFKTRTAIVPAGHCNTVKGVKERVRELAIDDLGYEPYYYRTWVEDDFLFIDFGNHSKLIVVKGMTIDDWIKA